MIRPAWPSEWNTAMDLALRTFEEYDLADCDQGGRESFSGFIRDPELKKLSEEGKYRLYTAVETLGVMGSGMPRAGRCNILGMLLLKDLKHISLLFVDSTRQGQGIGRNLVIFARNAAMSFGVSGELTVYSSTYARGFYHSLGFTECGQEQVMDGLRTTPMVWRGNYSISGE